MTISLKDHLAKERRFSWIPLFLLFCAIVVIIAYAWFFPAPQIYEGFIRLEPESARSKPYISFHLPGEKSESVYMVLLKEPAFYAKIEALKDKKVQVKARLYKNEPKDFDKIEIVEIREIR